MTRGREAARGTEPGPWAGPLARGAAPHARRHCGACCAHAVVYTAWCPSPCACAACLPLTVPFIALSLGRVRASWPGTTAAERTAARRPPADAWRRPRALPPAPAARSASSMAAMPGAGAAARLASERGNDSCSARLTLTLNHTRSPAARRQVGRRWPPCKRRRARAPGRRGARVRPGGSRGRGRWQRPAGHTPQGSARGEASAGEHRRRCWERGGENTATERLPREESGAAGAPCRPAQQPVERLCTANSALRTRAVGHAALVHPTPPRCTTC